jgi:hypothetical protein
MSVLTNAEIERLELRVATTMHVVIITVDEFRALCETSKQRATEDLDPGPYQRLRTTVARALEGHHPEQQSPLHEDDLRMARSIANEVNHSKKLAHELNGPTGVRARLQSAELRASIAEEDLRVLREKNS